MLKCKDAARLMSEALDRKVSLGELLQLKLHLGMCKGCRRYRQQITFIHRACRQHPGRGTKAPPARSAEHN